MSKKNKARPEAENPVVSAPAPVVAAPEAPQTPVVNFKEATKPKTVVTLPSGTVMETF